MVQIIFNYSKFNLGRKDELNENYHNWRNEES